MTEFPYLFSALDLNGVTLRNRIMTTAHVTNFAVDNLPSDQHVAYYGDRAKGGLGLIVMGFPSVHPSSRHAVAEIDGYDPRVVPGYQRIADAVHEGGAAIFAQLGHAGRQASSALSDRPLLAPSAIPCPWNLEMPKAMEVEDIDEVVEGHRLAAAHIKAGGLDGLELHSSYGGYLLSSFLSPYMNHRDDEYGGSRENRLRFVRRVIAAVREEVGPDFPVGMQMNGNDFSPGGVDLEEAQGIASDLVADGGIDYLTVKGATYFAVSQNIPDMQHDKALWLPLAAGIKEAVEDFPVFAVGRINDIEQAEAVLRNGQADMVAMTRQHIADPETANKAREGRLEDIRGCISCNQGCLDMLFASRHVTCIHNPAAGYERELGIGTLTEVDERRHTVVVGGGPGGMKAAEVAARRGHRVTLLERRDVLGGQIRLAASLDGRGEMGEIVRYLETQLKKLDVDVRLGTEASAASVMALEPDVVVVATGSAPTRYPVGHESQGMPAPAGADRDNVLTVWDVLEDDASVGPKVLIADDGEGNWKGVGLALHLAARGHAVAVSSPLPYIGARTGEFSQPKLLPRLFDAGIEMLPFANVTAIGEGSVDLVREGREETLADVDTVIFAGWHRPVEGLYFELKGTVEVHRVGDAVAARSALQAIHEAERLARSL